MSTRTTSNVTPSRPPVTFKKTAIFTADTSRTRFIGRFDVSPPGVDWEQGIGVYADSRAEAAYIGAVALGVIPDDYAGPAPKVDVRYRGGVPARSASPAKPRRRHCEYPSMIGAVARVRGMSDMALARLILDYQSALAAVSEIGFRLAGTSERLELADRRLGQLFRPVRRRAAH